MKPLLLSLTVLLAVSPVAASAADPHNDFDGDGRADLLWRNVDTTANVIWRNGVATSSLRVEHATTPDWRIAGSGDFDGDHHADILWRNRTTGAMVIWYAGSAARMELVRFDWAGNYDDPDWEIVGIDDFDGDGESDILWRNRITGNNAVGFVVRNGFEETFWYAYASNPIANLAWKVAGTGDFDGDGRAEVLWRSTVTGANVAWRFTDISSNTAFTATTLPRVNPSWQVAGIGDFNGDGHADVLWRNPATGANVLWPSASPAAGQTLRPASTSWLPASVADLDGDRHADIVWRNTITGANVAWMSGNAASTSRLASVTNQAWNIVP